MNPLPEQVRSRYLLNRDVRIGLVVVLGIVVLGFLVPWLSPHQPNVSAGGVPLVSPGLSNLFGTDNFGRDVMTRTFAAAKLDLALSVIGVSIPLVFGTFVGALLGYMRGGVVDTIGSVAIDSVNAFPFIVVGAAIIAVVGPGISGVILALAVTNWARYARVVRARALVVAGSDYMDAARVMGYSRIRVLRRHMLPNVSDVSLAYGVSDLVIVILAAAALSFLGLGVQPPDAEWGSMMAEGRLYLRRAWWMSVFPGVALSITAVGLSFLAEGVRSVQRDE